MRTHRQSGCNRIVARILYRNAVYRGRLTLGEREQVNAAYKEYKAAFDQALQAARDNYDAPTPENVKTLANEIIRMLWAMPY